MEPFWFLLSGSSLGAPLALIGAETPFLEPLFAPFPAPLSGANLAPSEADPAPFEAVPDPSGAKAPPRSPSSSLWCQSGSLEWSRTGSLFELKKRLLLELYRLLLERDSTTEPSFLKADTSSSLELYWLPWSEGSPWSDSSILELH